MESLTLQYRPAGGGGARDGPGLVVRPSGRRIAGAALAIRAEAAHLAALAASAARPTRGRGGIRAPRAAPDRAAARTRGFDWRATTAAAAAAAAFDNAARRDGGLLDVDALDPCGGLLDVDDEFMSPSVSMARAAPRRRPSRTVAPPPAAASAAPPGAGARRDDTAYAGADARVAAVHPRPPTARARARNLFTASARTPYAFNAAHARARAASAADSRRLLPDFAARASSISCVKGRSPRSSRVSRRHLLGGRARATSDPRRFSRATPRPI